MVMRYKATFVNTYCDFSGLAVKMRELEKFNRRAMDRELTMVKLKQEVNGLLAELGVPKKYGTAD